MNEDKKIKSYNKIKSGKLSIRSKRSHERGE